MNIGGGGYKFGKFIIFDGSGYGLMLCMASPNVVTMHTAAAAAATQSAAINALRTTSLSVTGADGGGVLPEGGGVLPEGGGVLLEGGGVSLLKTWLLAVPTAMVAHSVATSSSRKKNVAMVPLRTWVSSGILGFPDAAYFFPAPLYKTHMSDSENYVRAAIVLKHLDPVSEELDQAQTDAQLEAAGVKLAKAAHRIADEHLEEEAKRYADEQVTQEAQAAARFGWARYSGNEEAAARAFADSQCAAASPPCASRDARWDEFYLSYLGAHGTDASKEARRNAVFQEVAGMQGESQEEVRAARLACRGFWSKLKKGVSKFVKKAIPFVKRVVAGAKKVIGKVATVAGKVGAFVAKAAPLLQEVPLLGGLAKAAGVVGKIAGKVGKHAGTASGIADQVDGYVDNVAEQVGGGGGEGGRFAYADNNYCMDACCHSHQY